MSWSADTELALKTPPIIHLSVREGLSSVFLSQVAKPMQFLTEAGLDVQLAMVCPLGDYVRKTGQAAWRVRKKELDAIGVRSARIVSFPSRMQTMSPDRALLLSWLARHFNRQTPIIFHCRGTAATNLALSVRALRPNVRIVSDCRGVDGPEQAQYRGLDLSLDGPQWVRDLEVAQQYALAKSDTILCVSEAMKSYLVNEWSLSATNIGVVPCCYVDQPPSRNDVEVRAIREQYGFNEKVVFAHSASEAPWQRADEVVRLFARLAPRIPKAHFLFLTWKPEKAAEQCTQAGLDLARTTILSLRHGEVAKHLAAADIGVLFRDGSLVSRVASPVKFAEYLAAGLPVVLTPNLGDYSALVAKESIGLVMPSYDPDEHTLDKIVNFAQQSPDQLGQAQVRARVTANRVLNWSRYLEVFAAAYERATISRSLQPGPDAVMHTA